MKITIEMPDWVEIVSLRTVSVTWNDAIHHIIAAPTIVPAEGGGEE